MDDGHGRGDGDKGGHEKGRVNALLERRASKHSQQKSGGSRTALPAVNDGSLLALGKLIVYEFGARVEQGSEEVVVGPPQTRSRRNPAGENGPMSGRIQLRRDTAN